MKSFCAPTFARPFLALALGNSQLPAPQGRWWVPNSRGPTPPPPCVRPSALCKTLTVALTCPDLPGGVRCWRCPRSQTPRRFVSTRCADSPGCWEGSLKWKLMLLTPDVPAYRLVCVVRRTGQQGLNSRRGPVAWSLPRFPRSHSTCWDRHHVSCLAQWTEKLPPDATCLWWYSKSIHIGCNANKY